MSKVYIVNTNKTNNAQDEMEMINNQKCSAYYAPWKYKIDNIEANDLVFLYSNNRGIIARGIATGVVEVDDYKGSEDEEHYMHLNRFQELSNPLPPSKASDIVGYSIVWGQTMVSLDYDKGIKVWQYITKNCL